MRACSVLLVLAACGGKSATPRVDGAVIEVDARAPRPDAAPYALEPCPARFGLPWLPGVEVSAPFGVALADFNEDGHRDVAVLGGLNPQATNVLTILTGSANGTMTKGSSAPLGERTIAIALGDLDGDLHSDVVALTAPFSGSPTVLVLLGAGDGTFATPVTYALQDTPFGLIVADLHADAKPDVVVVGNTGVSILRGNGNGTLQARVNVPSSPPGTRVLAGQFDADPDMDLVVSADNSAGLTLMPGNGDNTFGPAATTIVGYAVGGVAAADFDEDADLDLVASHAPGASSTQNILLNNGSGVFAAGAAHPSLMGDVRAVDIDGDGDIDIADSTRYALGNGNGTFGTGVPVLAPLTYIAGFDIGAMDADGVLDFVFPYSQQGFVRVSLASTGHVFNRTVLTELAGLVQGVVAGDFNGDGNADVAVTSENLNPNYESGSVAVMLGSGTGTLTAPTKYEVGYAPTGLASADFNDDGRPDLVATHGFSQNAGAVIFVNTGTTFVRTAYPSGPTSGVVAAHFDADADIDLVLLQPQLALMSGNGDGTFSPGGGGPLTALQASAGDLDGDGDIDLALATPSYELALALNDGNGNFAAGPILKAATEHVRVAVADLDHDGDHDLVTRISNVVTIFIGAGNGTFVEQAPIVIAMGTDSPATFLLSVADMNGDGNSDIATSGSGAVALLRGTGTGSFLPAVYFFGDGPGVATDLDNDHRLDLFTSQASVGHVLMNSCHP